MSRKISFGKKARSLHVSIIVLVISIVLMFCVLIVWNAQTYNKIFQGYQDLQLYYSNISLATDELKVYLTSNEEIYLENYEALNEDIEQTIHNLFVNNAIKDNWIITLLKNMHEEYMLSANRLMNAYAFDVEQEEYHTYYLQFINNEKLIQGTSSEYYHLMTEMMQSQTKKIEFIQVITYAFSLVLLILVFSLILRFSILFKCLITKPLNKILNNIQLIENGIFELEEIEYTSEEIKMLSDGLSMMSKQIEKDREDEHLKFELEKKVVKSELKMLQNQINPHFLFNTLNTIYCMAEEHEVHDVSEMLYKTSNVLRYALEMQNRLSDLNKELEVIHSYIDIQQIRYGNRVKFTIDIAENIETSKITIPGMIIQPIIENCLKHGLINCEEGGIIEINVFLKDNKTVISVSDNGVGMDSKKIEQIMLGNYQNKETTSLGLYNVIHRLQMHFENRVDIELKSDFGCGFEFNIYISKEVSYV